MSTAMVTFNGRITLPSNVRKQLGLKTGDSVDFVEIEKGRFAIKSGSESAMGMNRAANEEIKKTLQ
jgi:AbrB family looped-hinge helix DNA binding protein